MKNKIILEIERLQFFLLGLRMGISSEEIKECINLAYIKVLNLQELIEEKYPEEVLGKQWNSQVT